jgi:hypothetical protein
MSMHVHMITDEVRGREMHIHWSNGRTLMQWICRDELVENENGRPHSVASGMYFVYLHASRISGNALIFHFQRSAA